MSYGDIRRIRPSAGNSGGMADLPRRAPRAGFAPEAARQGRRVLAAKWLILRAVAAWAEKNFVRRGIES